MKNQILSDEEFHLGATSSAEERRMRTVEPLEQLGEGLAAALSHSIPMAGPIMAGP
jgi:hypothetical protein